MKRTIFIFLLIMSAVAIRAELSGAQLLERCADKLRSAPSVSAHFVLHGSDGSSVDGEVLMSRERYRLTSSPLCIWYDGHTQWTALASAKEVNITVPTDEELLAGNPFAIISGYAGQFNCRLLPGSGSVRAVELTPKNADGDIRKATISIDTSTLWPTKAVILMAGGNTVTSTITNCRTGAKRSASAFMFNPSALPGYEVVDLR